MLSSCRCALENNDRLDLQAALERCVDDNLSRNGLPSSHCGALVGGEEHATERRLLRSLKWSQRA